MDSRLLAPALVWLLSAAACAHRQPQAIIVSSASTDGYALDYAPRLTSETDTLVADKQKANELVQKLGAAGGELKIDVEPALLLSIVRQADEAGRSAAFATANDEARGTRAFWDEERGRITGRVSGAAQKQLTEASCTEVDLSGAVGSALRDGVDRQLERRLRAENEAQRTIERNKGTIGPVNANALQRLADEIALASYLVNVALVRDRDRVDRLLSERSDVDSTLNGAIERERQLQPGARSAAEKKAIQERITEHERSRAAIPPAVASAEAARKELDRQIESAREQYRSYLEALETRLEAQAARATGA